MGAVLAVLAEVFELASVTGLSVDAILSGEAFTTAELLQAHIANLVTVGGLTEAEALAATEVTAEAYAALTSITSTFPQAFAALAATELTATGSLTVGAAVAAALYPYTYDHSTPLANLNTNMALQVWIPDLDLDFPGVRPFVRFVNYIDPAQWATDLFQAVGRYFWQTAQRYGQNLIEHELRETSRELAVTAVTSVSDVLARYFETARWAVSLLPRNIYQSLQNYYQELPPLNPIQVRQLQRRIGGTIPDRLTFHDTIQTAEYVEKAEAPGGANQRVAHDWLLPLLLGLYGDISPSWESTLEDLEEEEDAPQKKKRKKSK
ncbi:VP2 [Betapolyomavirus calbifrons]|uniref:Minor capsid protein n=1 Tax=Betapolyomavirus calbifrons TaxID=1236392 RepID=K7QLH5_9POLY|nr:VP2 [Betapolyomavirus calbifrons]AFU25614.1 VP2 [Betapolyomavirus calbifrons]